MIDLGSKQKRKHLKYLSSRTTVPDHMCLTQGLREKLGSPIASPSAAAELGLATPGIKTGLLTKYISKNKGR